MLVISYPMASRSKWSASCSVTRTHRPRIVTRMWQMKRYGKRQTASEKSSQQRVNPMQRKLSESHQREIAAAIRPFSEGVSMDSVLADIESAAQKFWQRANAEE